MNPSLNRPANAAQYLIVLLVAALLAGVIAGCSSPRTAEHLADAAALISLEDAYRDAKQTLTDRLDDFPEDTALALIALEEQTDALVADYRAAWAQPQSVEQISLLIQRTRLLYDQGHALVEPHLGALSALERQRLQRLTASWTRVSEAYDRWQSDPAAAQRRQMVTAGLELAAALLLVL